MSTPVAPGKMKRRQQIVQTYKIAKKTDRFLGLWILLAFLVGAAVGVGLFWFMPGPRAFWIAISAVLFGFLAASLTFGRRAQKAMYVQMEGQVGAAAAALQMLRRGWKLDPAIGFTKQQDVVHRVVGRPGIVLIAEGTSQARVKQLLVNERRNHERVAAGVPITEIICGNGEGEVPLKKVLKTVTKLDKRLKPADMTDVLMRLKALDANRSSIPLPKGPIPTSMKGQRGNLRGR